jgi:hypothetical protein
MEREIILEFEQIWELLYASVWLGDQGKGSDADQVTI